jgi:hypothetical protein
VSIIQQLGGSARGATPRGLGFVGVNVITTVLGDRARATVWTGISFLVVVVVVVATVGYCRVVDT